jgi:hypothetical protein
VRTPQLVVVFIALLCPAPRAEAQGSPAEAQNQSWDFSVWVSGATGEENTNSFAEAQILSAGAFAGRTLTGERGNRWRRGRLEYGADFIPVAVQFRPQSIRGIGFDPLVLRWNSSLHGRRMSPFIELAGGGLHTNANFPAGDTSSFNFMARAGAGITITTRRAQALEIACRWWHISNANLGTRNPEFNGIQVGVGWHFFR